MTDGDLGVVEWETDSEVELALSKVVERCRLLMEVVGGNFGSRGSRTVLPWLVQKCFLLSLMVLYA